MSVIPLILQGQGRTVVERRQDFEAAGGLEGQVILIQDLDPNQLRGGKDTNVSYDLRIGPEYRDHREVGKTELLAGGEIKLLPGTAVIVRTEESVHFPKSMFGQIVPKVSLLQMGISNTASKVDPGYNGNLLITIFNLGKKTIRLHRGEPFCSLYVLQVLEGAHPYDKQAKRIEGAGSRSRFRKVRDFLEINSALFSVLSIIATLVLTVVVIISIIR
jgi:deoxycytidine triphosphate deaminase